MHASTLTLTITEHVRKAFVRPRPRIAIGQCPSPLRGLVRYDPTATRPAHPSAARVVELRTVDEMVYVLPAAMPLTSDASRIRDSWPASRDGGEHFWAAAIQIVFRFFASGKPFVSLLAAPLRLALHDPIPCL
jgi:hypothetical protein